MKHVATLIKEPAGLVRWRSEHPTEAHATGSEAGLAWKRFTNSGDAYRELLSALLERQQGLCGYCEQRLTTGDGELVFNDYQIEHVHAKSGGTDRTLDWKNFLACCGGGTWVHHKDSTRHASAPRRTNVSCGQYKGDGEFSSTCDPRSFPWQQSVVEIGLDGRMRPNKDVCERAKIDPAELEHTIDKILNLNCERLRVARENVVNEIVNWVKDVLEHVLELSPNLPDDVATTFRREFVGGRLRPDEHGHLRRFWTTERQYLGEQAEAWILENAAMLNFL